MTDGTLVEQFIERSRTHTKEIKEFLDDIGIKDEGFVMGSRVGYAVPDDAALVNLYEQIKEQFPNATGKESIDKGYLVVPFGNDYFMFVEKEDDVNRYHRIGPKIKPVRHVYNTKALYTSDSNNPSKDPVYVCFSIVDVLIYRSLSYQAVFVDLNEIDTFIEMLDKKSTEHPLVITFPTFGENTQDRQAVVVEMGRVARRIARETETTVELSTILDSNPSEYSLKQLFRNNPKLVDQSINRDFLKINVKFDSEAALYEEQSVGPVLPRFKEFIFAASTRPRVPTGFPNLDEVLGGLAEGLYIIGAPPSTGKTTFAISMADYIAKKNDVLFFTLEQSTYENIAKSISRITYELRDQQVEARTHQDIMYGSDKWNEQQANAFDRAYRTYEKMVANRLFYFEKRADITGDLATDDEEEGLTKSELDEIMGRRIGPFDIETAISRHLQLRPESHPVVFLDYIQVLAPINTKYSDKQNIDASVSQLRYIAAQYHVPIVAISSLNRASTDTNLGMTALSGSGNLEYGADVVMILQAKDLSKKTTIAAMNNNRITNDEMKESDDRELELAIRKNRYGHCRPVYFDFNARFSSFRPVYPGQEDTEEEEGNVFKR